MGEVLKKLSDALTPQMRYALCPVNWVDEDLEYAAEGVVSLEKLQEVSSDWGLVDYHNAVHHYEILWTRLSSTPIDRVDDSQWVEWYRRIPLIASMIPCLKRGISVNVESAHMVHPVFLSEIRRMILDLNEIGVHTAIEWTERHHPGVDIREVAHKILLLRDEFGVEIHLDDVGSTGVDTLARAILVSPDMVKIDGELFHSARNDPWILEALRAHTDTYHRMMIGVVVEWTENSVDVAIASDIGCDYLQGWCFNND